MRRREFISLLGGAVSAWPLAARAQQNEQVRRIGVLMPFIAGDPEAQVRSTVFAQTLQQLGWTVGRNLQIDYRFDGAGCLLHWRWTCSHAGSSALALSALIPVACRFVGCSIRSSPESRFLGT